MTLRSAEHGRRKEADSVRKESGTPPPLLTRTSNARRVLLGAPEPSATRLKTEYARVSFMHSTLLAGVMLLLDEMKLGPGWHGLHVTVSSYNPHFHIFSGA